MRKQKIGKYMSLSDGTLNDKDCVHLRIQYGCWSLSSGGVASFVDVFISPETAEKLAKALLKREAAKRKAK